MASSRANLSKKAKLIGIGAAIGLVIGAFSVFMLFTYNPPDKQEEPNVDVAVLMSEISQINELATASQTYTVVEKVESNSKLFDTIDIPFSENFFILTYMGELKAGVNLDEAQVALEGTTVKVSLPQATILSDAIDTTSLKYCTSRTTSSTPSAWRTSRSTSTSRAKKRRLPPSAARCSTRPRRTPSRPSRPCSAPPCQKATRSKSARRRRTRRRNSRFG